MDKEEIKSIFKAALAYILWGAFPIYWKLVQNFDSAFILSVRVITTFILSLIIIISNKSIKKLYRGKRHLFAILLAGISLGFNWYLYIFTVNSGRVLEAGLAYYIAPIITILIGIIIFREKKTALEYVAIVVMFIGVIYQTITIGHPPLMALSIALTFSIYSLCKKTTIYSGWESLFLETAAILIPSLFLFKMYMPTTSEPTIKWITLLFSGVVTGVPLYLYAKAAKNIPISTLGFLQFITPFMATLLGIFLYKEYMSLNKAITFIIIILAFILYAISMVRTMKK